MSLWYEVIVASSSPNLGQVCAVIGAQWGDEGKGKIVDRLAEEFDVIARGCGGANAGHTIVVAGQKHVFHLVPSGALHAGKTVMLGAGMVIHLPTLMEEIKTLQQAGVTILDRLFISKSAHLVLEAHLTIDARSEEQRTKSSSGAIGTTKRGIGPAYADKARRIGIRADVLQQSPADVKTAVQTYAELIASVEPNEIDVAAETNNLLIAKKMLETCVHNDVPGLLHKKLQAKQRVLIEGAQATLLDIDHGTYPFVTSSATTVAGALQGLGLAPRWLHSCIGVAKAYCTRVGGGRFLTEADEKQSSTLRERGGEYGATTGRPRRCGWLHLPDLHYAARINGFTQWNITKLDVFDALSIIPIGIGERGGKATYKEMPGWRSSTAGVQSWEKLPKAAQQYLLTIEQETGVPVSYIGTGPGREDMIVR